MTEIQRSVLPIPETVPVGLTTYDAKDPNTSFPPIEPLRPPAGAPERAGHPDRRRRLRRVERVRWPVRTRRTRSGSPAAGSKFNRFHTTALCSPTRAGAADRSQPPHRGHGRDHRDRDLGARLQLGAAQHAAPLAEILKLNGYSTAQFGKCHEVPVWETSPMGPFHQWPTGTRLRVLLRLHRRRDEPVLPGDLRGHHAGRAAEDPGGGLPLHRGHDRQGDRVGAPAEVADARQAVLHVLRAGRDPRAAPRARWSGPTKYQGKFDAGLGRAPRGDLRPPEGARRDPGRRRAHRAARRDPGVGRHARRAEAGARPPDGGLRRASSSTPTTTSAASSTRSTISTCSTTRSSTTSSATTARAPRARSTARSTSCSCSTARPRSRRADSMASHVDEFGDPDGVQPLRGRLGARDGHAVPVDEAGRLALGRHPQRHDRALAERLQGQGRDPHAVPPRDRRRADRPRRRRPSRADVRERHPADAAARREHALLLRRRRGRRDGTRRSTSRCSATAASTTRAGPR